MASTHVAAASDSDTQTARTISAAVAAVMTILDRTGRVLRSDDASFDGWAGATFSREASCSVLRTEQ